MNPNTFKKGDKFKIFGGTFTVSYISGPYVYYQNDGDGMNSVHHTNCTLVESKFSVGDIVRHATMTDTGLGTVQCANDDNTYRVKWNSMYGYCRDPGEKLILVSRANAIADYLADGKYIEAIKEYRVIHGCGLKEAKDEIDALRNKPKADKFAAEGQTLGDILGKALASRNKFKVGDKVTTEDDKEDVGTVQGYQDGFYAVLWTGHIEDGNPSYIWRESELFAVVNYAPTIVVRYDAGKGYRPNDKPRVHNNVAEATAEAERLAKANPGVKFDTFTLVTSSVATAPVEATVTTVSA